MNDQRPGVKTFFQLLLIFIFSVGKLQAQDGSQIFTQNCASCHGVFKAGTGPALKDLETRGPWSDRKKLYEWVHNPPKFMASDPYTQGLRQEFGGIVMTAFPQLSEKEIDAIVDYINKAQPPKKPGDGGTATQGATDDTDSSILYGILTLILAVVALIMLQVNANLRKLADDKEGIPAREPIPFYRNKSYIAIITFLLFVVGGYFVVKGAINLGRSQNYQPEQPIYYSHKVHAGTNQISCLYCHGGAFEGKQANIPSLNTCMNCHMNISEYTGEDLFKHDGTKVDGTAEIQKIYEHTGWDPTSRSYTGEGKPVEWVRIHNLPDHVYFNHSQHTVAGGVQCQTCHGEIQKMDEVKQFADLSMGWCINCHRETKVNFVDSSGTKGNQFYSIYEKYHDEIKRHVRDSITVSDIGGTECQKCHY
ncbi:MAG: c-type cytochrome [Chitinophagaceae bacterium]|nr:c-type cytochrome [Chitinophagaceae bacterium]